jgi:ribose transport system substrate-binding protein
VAASIHPGPGGEKMGLLRDKRLLTVGAVVIVAVVSAVGALAGTASERRPQAPERVRIGYVLPDLANPFIAGLRDGAVEEAKKRRVTLLVKGTNDSAGQTNAFLAYVGARVDAIGIDSIDSKAIIPAVRKANEARIPVVAIQAQPAGGRLATFIAADNFQGGVLIGRAIVQYCRGKNPCKVGIVEGNLADQSGRDEDRGMRSVVRRSPNIRIVAHQPTNYDPARALNVATNMLTANPDLNYIYSWWDQGALAALEAVRAKDKEGEVGISGFGGNCLNLAEVVKGNIYQETVFFPEYMGALMVRSALTAIRGGKLRPRISAPIMSVTAPLAKALLNGSAKPPKGLPIVSKLRRAQSGRCPR